MKAVHFGAGNIGRGFVGEILAASDYEVVFADIDDGLVDALQDRGAYAVRQVGTGAVHRVSGVRAVHSVADEARLIDEIATADLVTTAVGVRNLAAVAPLIARGIQRRLETGDDVIDGRLAVIACENAIDASALLQGQVRLRLPESEGDALSAVALFANTAIDRIVPGQPEDAGLDVTLEPFFEWVIDRTPFAGAEPAIAGVHWTDDLAPFLERKLFTVNTGHAVAAYHGFVRGIHGITDAMAHPEVLAEVRAAVDETRALLVAKHGLDDAEQREYVRARASPGCRIPHCRTRSSGSAAGRSASSVARIASSGRPPSWPNGVCHAPRCCGPSAPLCASTCRRIRRASSCNAS